MEIRDHVAVHDYCTRPQIRQELRPVSNATLDHWRKRATRSALDAWTSEFYKSSYQSNSNFLKLCKEDGQFLEPKYANGGTWLPHLSDTRSTSRAVRAILKHTPIGEYRLRFHPKSTESPICGCGRVVETRYHIFQNCPLYKEAPSIVRSERRVPRDLETLKRFLDANPAAFAFKTNVIDAG